MFDSARIAHENNIKNVMITAGYIHEKPLRDLCKHIDAANVDLKSFSNQTYIKLNAGTIKPVLRTLQIMKEEGVWLEITNLVVPEWTDDLEMIKKMCVWLYQNGFKDTPLHFSRFHPTYKLSRLPATPVTTLKKARQIAQDAGLRYVYIGNVPDSGAEDTVCPNCGKTIIKRRGFYIQQNNLQNNACPDCNQKIAGFWDS
jgi:pyruvate formate lyase activating enzyme